MHYLPSWARAAVNRTVWYGRSSKNEDVGIARFRAKLLGAKKRINSGKVLEWFELFDPIIERFGEFFVADKEFVGREGTSYVSIIEYWQVSAEKAAEYRNALQEEEFIRLANNSLSSIKLDI